MNDEKQRIRCLDGLRGLAALSVVMFHYLYHFQSIGGHQINLLEFHQGVQWLEFAQFSVHLFFAISGFVIIMVLSRHATPGAFLWARFSRLVPVFWVCVIITFLAVSVLGPHFSGNWSGWLIDPWSLPDLISSVLMIDSFTHYQKVDEVYWSLYIEMAFYLLVAIMLVFSRTLSQKNIRFFAWSWLIASFVGGYLIQYWNHNSDYQGMIYTLLNHALIVQFTGLFTFGIGAYWVYTRKFHPMDGFLILLSLVHVYLSNEPMHALYIYGFLGVFTLTLSGFLKFLRSRIMLWLGSISYALYLIHCNLGYLIMTVFYDIIPNSTLALIMGLISATAFSIFLAHILTQWVEVPANKALRRWFYPSSDKIMNKTNHS